MWCAKIKCCDSWVCFEDSLRVRDEDGCVMKNPELPALRVVLTIHRDRVVNLPVLAVFLFWLVHPDVAHVSLPFLVWGVLCPCVKFTGSTLISQANFRLISQKYDKCDPVHENS